MSEELNQDQLALVVHIVHMHVPTKEVTQKVL